MECPHNTINDLMIETLCFANNRKLTLYSYSLVIFSVGIIYITETQFSLERFSIKKKKICQIKKKKEKM